MNRKDMKKMWVWDSLESNKMKRFVLWNDDKRAISVYREDEKDFLEGLNFDTTMYQCCAEIKTETRVKSQANLLRWLADNEHEYDPTCEAFVKPGSLNFNLKMFSHCNKDNVANWSWNPEWIEEVEA